MAFRPPTDPHEPNEPRETTDSPKQEAAGKQRGSPLLAISFVITLTALAALAGAGVSQRKLREKPRARRAAMADVGEWFEDSATGDHSRARLLQTTEDRLDVQVECRPSSAGMYLGRPCSPPLRRLSRVHQWITVRSGSLGYVLGGGNGTVTDDHGTIDIPAGTRYTWWNADPNTVLDIILTFSPRANQERLLRTMYGLGQDYGKPTAVPMLQQLVSHAEAGSQLWASQRAWDTLAARVVVPLAHFMGFRPWEADYSLVPGIDM